MICIVLLFLITLKILIVTINVTVNCEKPLWISAVSVQCHSEGTQERELSTLGSTFLCLYFVQTQIEECKLCVQQGFYILQQLKLSTWNGNGRVCTLCQFWPRTSYLLIWEWKLLRLQVSSWMPRVCLISWSHHITSSSRQYRKAYPLNWIGNWAASCYVFFL